MEPMIAGIDIAKRKFDVVLLGGGKEKHGSFHNTEEGFAAFTRWLQKEGIDHVHACMEATGTYGDKLAEYLHERGHVVSVVNPARIKGFGQGEMVRTKTDKADARLIARFCQVMKPAPWEPMTAEIKQLRALVRRYDELNDMLSQERNRLATAEEEVRPFIRSVINLLTKQLDEVRRLIHRHIDQNPGLREKRDLLESIPGVGPVTSAAVLAEFGDVNRFSKAKCMASFCGLTPRQRQSGSSVRGRSRISKTGSWRIRRTLYMPAVVARSYNPALAALSTRLRERGKCTMVIIAAVMRKLVHIIFGVLKSGRPFDPQIAAAH